MTMTGAWSQAAMQGTLLYAEKERHDFFSWVVVFLCVLDPE
jgi:hypothetical protein